MLRLFQPCLPTRVKTAPSGPLWVHEIKHDGFRIVARKAGGVVRLYSKQGYDWSGRYPQVVDALMRMRANSIVLDGELVCFGRRGEHDFDRLWNRAHDEEARLCAFDLLELNGEDYRGQPLLDRKRRLRRLLSKPRDGLEYVEHLEGDGAVIFEHACKLGLEGIVSKRWDMPYRAGPTKLWLKIKNPAHPAMLRIKQMHERERITP
jgi:ATP-dependent DNA ligase